MDENLTRNWKPSTTLTRTTQTMISLTLESYPDPTIVEMTHTEQGPLKLNVVGARKESPVTQRLFAEMRRRNVQARFVRPDVLDSMERQYEKENASPESNKTPVKGQSNTIGRNLNE